MYVGIQDVLGAGICIGPKPQGNSAMYVVVNEYLGKRALWMNGKSSEYIV